MTEGRLSFYYRDGCHLCEAMASLLHRGWPDVMANLIWLDVDSRPEWRERYGLRVPVLEKNGQVLCELAADRQCLQEHFGSPVNPV
jgi:hypothetical protein